LASVFWDRDGILLVDYLEKGATIMRKYHVARLDKLKQRRVSKRQDKPMKGIILLQYSAAPHKVDITQQKLEDFTFKF
jgi:hypothetical protein